MKHSADGKEHQIRIYNDPEEDLEDDVMPEYDFDFSQALPNPYAVRARERLRMKEQAGQEEEKDYSSKMQRELGIVTATDKEQAL